MMFYEQVMRRHAGLVLLSSELQLSIQISANEHNINKYEQKSMFLGMPFHFFL